MDKNIRHKVTFVFIVFILGFAAVIGRLAYINIVKGEEFRTLVEDDKLYTSVLYYERGSILDRNGAQMAFSVTEYKITIANVKTIPVKTLNEIIEHLAENFEISPDEIYEKNNGVDNIVVSKNATKIQKESIDIKYHPYLWLDGFVTRHYPNEQLAADVLGRTQYNEEEKFVTGTYGVEQSYNDRLTGKNGYVETQSDNQSRELVHAVRNETKAEDGLDVYLTIDAVVQHYVEQALEAAFIEHDPLAAHAIVMNVNTGEIIAMASYPGFEPNTMELVGMPEERFEGLDSFDKNLSIFKVWNNDNVQSVYELGSTLKLITAAIALEENIATPDTKFDEGNNVQVADWNIKCWYYPQSHGIETLTEAVGFSCNPVFVKLGQMMGKETFYKYYEDFGLSVKTNIDLPKEASPVTYTLDQINETELATMTFGHGVAQSPIQVATAIAAVVNGGYLLEPHVVKRVVDKDGLIIDENVRTVKRQVVSEITSQQMRTIMEHVVDNASGSAVQIPGYRIGGKTGTSEKAIDGEYSSEKAIASFVAVAPINDPEILVYVVIDEPKDEIYGSKVAGPITRDILVDTLDYLDIAKDDSKLADVFTVPDVIGLNLEAAKEVLEKEGFRFRVVTDKTFDDTNLVINQFPKGGSQREPDSTILLEINN